MKLELSLTYDDVQLVPSYSEVMSRGDVDLTTQFTRNYKIKLPFIAAPMDTVCGFEMGEKLMKLGGVGIIHRFMSVDDQVRVIQELKDLSYSFRKPKKIPVAGAVGVGDGELSRAKSLLSSGCTVILIDVAHGHHKNVKDMLKSLNELKQHHKFDVIAGNIATKEGAVDLIEWGVDALRVGIGGGSVCQTRIQTGHGIPNITSLIDVCSVAKQYDIPVIADGGIRSSGDIAKALSVGADTVMLGSLLAGTTETPGEVIEQNSHLHKRYRGSASLETKIAHHQKQNHVEGISTTVPYKGGVKYVIQRLTDGLTSAFSYSGAMNMMEYYNNTKLVQVTNSGVNEANPHILNK